MFYRDLIEYLKLSKLDYEDAALNLLPMPHLKCNVTLRDYQKDALHTWLRTRNGVLVLPTGAGKTVIGIKAVSELNVPTLVIVPTLELVKQWKRELESKFGLEIGTYSGEGHVLKPITVATYDTAYLRAEELGNRFLLLLFDEL